MSFKYDSKELAEEFEKAFLNFGDIFKDSKKVYKELQSRFSENGRSNIYLKDDKLYIEVLAVNIPKEDIKVNLVEDIIEVKSTVQKDEDVKYTLKEFTLNELDKKFKISQKYLDGDFDISLKNGLLTIIVTKKEQKKQSKEFKIL